MIHYHGTPITPESAAAQILMRRHAMVSFAHPEQIDLVADACQSFALDNGAFSAWRAGRPITDWGPFYEWVAVWQRHPGFDWFLIPDVIDGSEEQNDALVFDAALSPHGVPVWHLHESLDRIERLIGQGFPRIAIGSSGEFAQIGAPRWRRRMAGAMSAFCDEQGRPRTRLHGLRMLDPYVFASFPFASADSTNIARNIGLDGRWTGSYSPATKSGRGGSSRSYVAFDCKALGRSGFGIGEVSPTLRAMDDQVAIAIQTANTKQNGRGYREDVAYTVDTSGPQSVATNMAVRRLTVRECERLQGFPDDYTLIPMKRNVISDKKLDADYVKYMQRTAQIRFADGRIIEGEILTREQCRKLAADGPRYKALGNSMAVSVMRWIGERIQMVEGIK